MFLLVVAIALLVVAALVAVERLEAEKAEKSASPVQREGADPRVWPADLIVPSSRSFKADQIEDLGYAPEVIFFGGSRSVRFEPSYVQEKTKLKGFNLALTSGKPEDAWAFAHLLYDRSPQTKLRWIWGIQPWTFSDRQLEAGLIQDPRLNKYFPDDLLRQEGEALPQTPDKVPKNRRGYDWRFARDGTVLWNFHDKKLAEGWTLERELEKYIAKIPKKAGAEDPDDAAAAITAPERTRALTYFEDTLGYLNEHGVVPILVAMPIQPTALKALVEAGRQKAYPSFLAYVDSLHEKYDFEFIDLREIETFGGDPTAFYDIVHMKFANSRRVIDKLIETYPEQFAK